MNSKRENLGRVAKMGWNWGVQLRGWSGRFAHRSHEAHTKLGGLSGQGADGFLDLLDHVADLVVG
jgi:hypothetical protein